jgi:hypothetical protein
VDGIIGCCSKKIAYLKALHFAGALLGLSLLLVTLKEKRPTTIAVGPSFNLLQYRYNARVGTV